MKLLDKTVQLNGDGDQTSLEKNIDLQTFWMKVNCLILVAVTKASVSSLDDNEENCLVYYMVPYFT